MNICRITIWLLLAAFSLCTKMQAKDTARSNVPAIVMQFGGGYFASSGDLHNRFPLFSTFQAGAFYRSTRDFYSGFEYQRFLGNRFTLDSLYGGILGPSQQIVDINGNPAVIRYYMRGYTLDGYIGKAFKLSPKMKYGKLRVDIGGGFMLHYIKMRFDKSLLPQLEGDYAAGYDRLCNGFMLREKIRYQYYNLSSLCFFAGLDFMQGFTQNQRNWDFSTQRKDATKRKDLAWGFSAGVQIPINLRPAITNEYLE